MMFKVPVLFTVLTGVTKFHQWGISTIQTSILLDLTGINNIMAISTDQHHLLLITRIRCQKSVIVNHQAIVRPHRLMLNRMISLNRQLLCQQSVSLVQNHVSHVSFHFTQDSQQLFRILHSIDYLHKFKSNKFTSNYD